MIRILVLISVFFSGSLLAAAAQQSYWQLPQASQNETDNLYFTWLGCHSCLMLEQKLDLSGFQVLPLIARADWRPAAKIQIAMTRLSLDTSVVKSFKQMILQQKVDVKSLDSMTAALVSLGVDKEQLEQQLASRELFAAISLAVDKAKQYQVRYAPTVIVKGQYATDAKSTGSVAKFAETLQLLKRK